jgi:hypothetical protein
MRRRIAAMGSAPNGSTRPRSSTRTMRRTVGLTELRLIRPLSNFPLASNLEKARHADGVL